MAGQLRVDRALTMQFGPYRLRSPPPRASVAMKAGYSGGVDATNYGH